MFRFVKVVVLFGAMLLCLGFATAIGGKYILEAKANNAAQSFIGNHINDSMEDEEKILEISKAVILPTSPANYLASFPFCFACNLT